MRRIAGDAPRLLAPRGRRQVAEASLAALEEILLAHPLITARAAATLSGVSRDTANRWRQQLVGQGLLPPPGRELNLERNRERFRKWRESHPERSDWQPRSYRRHQPVSITVIVNVPSADGGPDWEQEIAVEWLHRCAEGDRCGDNAAGEAKPCRLLAEEGARNMQGELLAGLARAVGSPDYRRRVLGEQRPARPAPTWISAHRL